MALGTGAVLDDWGGGKREEARSIRDGDRRADERFGFVDVMLSGNASYSPSSSSSSLILKDSSYRKKAMPSGIHPSFTE